MIKEESDLKIDLINAKILRLEKEIKVLKDSKELYV